MDLFLKKYGTPLSLGSTCLPKFYIKGLTPAKQNTNPNHFFDYVGSSMWSICDLFRNDFCGVGDLEQYKELDILEKKKISVITHMQYYIRFLHDIRKQSDRSQWNECAEKYVRRGERIMELLRNSKQMLFLRLEESMTDRILHESYIEKYSLPEIEYVAEFSKIVKEKYPLLDFVIFYISKTEESRIMKEEKIVVLKDDLNLLMKPHDPGYTEFKRLNLLFEKNRGWLSSMFIEMAQV